MRVIRKGSGEPFDDLFPGTYEFKLCGGCVTPDDRVSSMTASDGEPAENDTADSDAPTDSAGETIEDGDLVGNGNALVEQEGE